MKKSNKSKKTAKKTTLARKRSPNHKTAPSHKRSRKPMSSPRAMEMATAAVPTTDQLIQCRLPSGQTEWVTREKCEIDGGIVIENTP
jgi:hypothetical protein